MLDWRKVVEHAKNAVTLSEDLVKQNITGLYKNSVQRIDNHLFFMVREGLVRFLIVIGDGHVVEQFEGEVEKLGQCSVRIAPLNGHNAQCIRSLFPWSAPQALGPRGVSIGLGDRLGLASPGHIESIQNTVARPILAQQSMRELELTKRTYGDVLNAATWAVFQEGYTQGFGADGDHLKKMEDIQTALNLGFSMITLDCSEYIDDGVRLLDDDQVSAAYTQLSETTRFSYEALYKDSQHWLNACNDDSSVSVSVDAQHYYRMVLTYYRALDFIEAVYRSVITKTERIIDFEVSIDEIDTPTSPQDHFFIGNELARRGIEVSGIAPRFCGAFEKGIDYIGDVAQFEKEFATHASIAKHFGYKLSIHSGSDKFSVFPIIGNYAQSFHVKTAGTNWLEAVRVIADVDPGLYRKMHAKSLASLDAARKYYKVSLDLAKIPDITDLDDQKLPDLMNQDDARQLLHITYGFILQDPELREALYATLSENEETYKEYLRIHLGRHLAGLGL